jgi:hypothetical protein
MERRERLEEDEEMIVTPQTFGLLFSDWTNPEKIQEAVQ